MTHGDHIPRLLREQLEREMPATIDLWPRIAAQLPVGVWDVRPLRRQRLVVVGLVTILVLGMVFGVSPAARAAVTTWLRTIAGVRFVEQTTPGPVGPVTRTEQVVEPRSVRVIDLAREVPMALRLPTPPADYFLESVATGYPPTDLEQGWRVVLRWRPDPSAQPDFTAQHRVELTVYGDASTMGLVTHAEMTEEVVVAGAPTALTRGIWLDNDGRGVRWQTKADGEEYLMLSWMDGEERYQLSSTKPGFLPHLIAMAATIRNP